ncbi:hypothetical protein J4468_01080 [Candidatus Woesearchaeota archaeon]|nr:hypothetical protein [Candidatus Woesearchaeota archaeon]
MKTFNIKLTILAAIVLVISAFAPFSDAKVDNSTFGLEMQIYSDNIKTNWGLSDNLLIGLGMRNAAVEHDEIILNGKDISWSKVAVYLPDFTDKLDHILNPAGKNGYSLKDEVLINLKKNGGLPGERVVLSTKMGMAYARDRVIAPKYNEGQEALYISVYSKNTVPYEVLKLDGNKLDGPFGVLSTRSVFITKDSQTTGLMGVYLYDKYIGKYKFVGEIADDQISSLITTESQTVAPVAFSVNLN